MNTLGRIVIVVVVIAVGMAIVFAKRNRAEPVTPEPAPVEVSNPVDAPTETSLPSLLELGSTECKACKAMGKVLDQLEVDLEGQLEISFIDVLRNREMGKVYEVSIIPVQIFFDEEGTELFRNTGFFPREDILKKWHELGYEFQLPEEPAEG